jgi:hypothetical protein
MTRDAAAAPFSGGPGRIGKDVGCDDVKAHKDNNIEQQ